MSSLPLWLQIVGLIGGLLWPVYQLIIAVIGPKLEVKLTRDLFFRFIVVGECLFIRSVLLAERGSVLIKNVEAKLKRTGPGAEKKWDLEFLKFGEVMSDNKNVEPNFCFQSTSPLKFLTKGLPVHAIYLGRAKGYGPEYANIIKEMDQQLLVVKENADQAINNNESKTQDELNEKVLALSKLYANKIFDKIQLEAGRYEVELKIIYSSTSGLGAYFSRRTKSSKLSFEIETDAREQIKSSLPAAVHNVALNKVSSLNLQIKFPEYSPINIQEDVTI